MAIICSETGSGMAADAALTTTRTLDNALGGSGTRTWANPGTGTFIRSNGSDTFFGYEDSARAWVSVATADYQVMIDFNMASACNIVVGGLKTTGGGGWDASLVALIVGLTEIRIRQYDSGGTPTDLATATLSAGGISTGTDYKLQLVKSGNALTCNVRNAGGSIRDSLPFTAVAALPTGAFWGFGLLNGGTTATMKNFIVEDAPVASTLWGNVANV
jgi:hypothetical protein